MRLLFVLGLVGSSLAVAQPKAQISGFVRDSTSGVVREAAIAVLNLDTGVRRSTHSGGDGFYAVSSLTPGQYKITVRCAGFQTVARTGVGLHAMDSARLDFVLEVGSTHEEITVVDTTPLINSSDGSQGMQTGRNPAQNLPINGRGLQALIDLAPGVLTTPATAGEAGQFSANGQRPATNYFTVDGVSANNGVSGSGLPGQFSGGALPAMTAIGSLHNLVSLGELDELRIQTSTYAPEYGRLPGAQVAVSTRSGSNDYHGDVFASGRHELVSAMDTFVRAAGQERPAQRLFDGGASFGGPLQRNRTFFHLSTEHIRLRQPATFLTVVPSLAAREAAPPVTRSIIQSFPLPDRPGEGGGVAALHTATMVNPSAVDTTAARIDHSVSASGLLFFRYNRAPSSTESGYYGRNRASFDSQTATLGFLSVLGPRMTNDLRLGHSRTTVESEWLPGAIGIDPKTLLPSPGEGQRLYGIGIRGIGQILTGDPGRSRQTQWNLNDTVSVTAGRHDLRFGIDYQRLSPTRDQPIASVTSTYDSLDRLVLGAIPAYTFAQTGGGSSLIETLSVFAQDTWRVTPRLNITFGLRQEFTPPPSYRSPLNTGTETTVTPSPFPWPFGVEVSPEFSETPEWTSRYNQFAPRIGAAYRLGDNLVIRAGAGVFYDLSFSSAVDLVNGAPYNRFRSFGSVGSVANLNQPIQYGFARDLKLPYTAHWNVTIEKGIGRESAASIGYVGSLGKRLLRREGYLDPFAPRPRLVLATNNGESSYHSMQMMYRSRDLRGLQGTVSYTLAHAIDNGSWDSATYLVFRGVSDRASSNFDVRHSFQAALSYDLGRIGARGWLVSGTFRSRTGFPIDVISADNPFGLGFDNDVRPDLVPGVPIWIGRQLNPAAFSVPVGRQGSLGRNAITGFGLTQLDLAVQRDLVTSEQTRLQFRVEAYNVTNTPNYADPVRMLSSPLFGMSPSLANLMLGSGRPNSGLTPAFQSGGPRVFQAGFTLRF